MRTPLADALGKIVYEAAPFAIGAAVACHLFDQSPDEPDGDSTGRPRTEGAFVAPSPMLGSTFVGAVFVGFNIAPTEEIPRLAAASSPPRLLAVMGLSLLVSYGIVFQAGFRDQARRRQQRGILQHPITETAAGYVVALIAAAAMLLFFRNVQPATIHGRSRSTTSCSSAFPPPSVARRGGSRYEHRPAAGTPELVTSGVVVGDPPRAGRRDRVPLGAAT